MMRHLSVLCPRASRIACCRRSLDQVDLKIMGFFNIMPCILLQFKLADPRLISALIRN